MHLSRSLPGRWRPACAVAAAAALAAGLIVAATAPSASAGTCLWGLSGYVGAYEVDPSPDVQDTPSLQAEDNTGNFRAVNTAAPGTSPAIATAPDCTTGAYQFVWQGTNNHLWTTSATGPTDLGLAMAPDTSPTLVEPVNGGYEAGFQGANGDAWFTGPAFTTDTGLAMAPGTSPTSARNTGGWDDFAWQGANGHLWKTTGHGPVDLGLVMMPGTSPAMAYLGTDSSCPSSNCYEIAAQGANGDLWTTGTSGTTDWGPSTAMDFATSPAITATPAGGFFVAYITDDGHVWVRASTGGAFDVTHASGVSALGTTSPAIVAQPGAGVWVVAFDDSGGAEREATAIGIVSPGQPIVSSPALAAVSS
jgi:hypothetical protein